MSRLAPLNDEPPPGLSRRGVLRGVAWAAPLILVASAAPAASASEAPNPFSPGGTAVIHFQFAETHRPNTGGFWVGVGGGVGVQRDWGEGDVTSLTLNIVYPSSLGLTLDKAQVDINGSGSLGWNVLAVSTDGTNTIYTFGWVGHMGVVGNTGNLTFTIPSTLNALGTSIPAFTVTYNASSPDATASITTQSFSPQTT